MARVAANQDTSEAERAHFVYLQHARVSSAKGKTVHCEEITDTRVTPSDAGSTQQLIKLQGRVLADHGKYVAYTDLLPGKDAAKSGTRAEHHDLTINLDGGSSGDRELVEGMRNNFMNDRSRDGIGAGLFPLTSKTQADYAFRLLGREKLNGRDVFHIVFTPKVKGEYGWKGDAYIDTTAYQPVLVHTAMARNVPFAVRALLGTSIPGLGFTVIYAPEPQDTPGAIWFPTSFGTEFKLKILFFYSRQITISAANGSFERTHVTSTVIDPRP